MSGLIEIYTNTLTAVAGEVIRVHVSTTARHFDLKITRIGLQEELVWSRGNLMGSSHATPENAWEQGCRWPAAVELVVPQGWKSGYYEIKATVADVETPGTESRAFVVIRAALPTAKILLVLTTSTYGAYNNYGGASIYLKKGNRPGSGFLASGEHRISFRRPWMPGFVWKPEGFRADYCPWEVDGNTLDKKTGLAAPSYFAGFPNWERTMVRWLERNGYHVDYAVSSDLEFHPELLPRYRMMLSVGHDEYWSWAMRDTVESGIYTNNGTVFCAGTTDWVHGLTGKDPAVERVTKNLLDRLSE